MKILKNWENFLYEFKNIDVLKYNIFDWDDNILFMEKGLAKVFLDDGVNSLVLKVIPDGNFLGLASVSEEHSTYRYSAMAYVDSFVKQIDINIFRKLLTENTRFANCLLDRCRPP